MSVLLPSLLGLGIGYTCFHSRVYRENNSKIREWESKDYGIGWRFIDSPSTTKLELFKSKPPIDKYWMLASNQN